MAQDQSDHSFYSVAIYDLNLLDTVLVSFYMIEKLALRPRRTLASLGILHGAFGLLKLYNHVETSKTVSNYYLDHTCKKYCHLIGHRQVSIPIKKPCIFINNVIMKEHAVQTLSLPHGSVYASPTSQLRALKYVFVVTKQLIMKILQLN